MYGVQPREITRNYFSGLYRSQKNGFCVKININFFSVLFKVDRSVIVKLFIFECDSKSHVKEIVPRTNVWPFFPKKGADRPQ